MEQNPLFIAALLCAVGAVLGGALAHYHRGRDMILTGAIIGGAAGAAASIAALYYVALLAPLALVGLLGFFVLNWLFG
jgi:hypothetical protein